MLAAGNAKHRILFLFCCLLMAVACFSQPAPAPGSPGFSRPLPVTTNRPGLRIVGTEVCGNNIDDDGNGLIDDKDFSCYYSSTAAGCPVTTVIWVNTANALYWVDPVGGGYRQVGPFTNYLLDIAWSSTGRLYGISYLGIVEMDPYTGQQLSTSVIPGYTPVNAMTGDGKGNLFLTATVSVTAGPPGDMYVIKYSTTTGQATPIVNLTAAQLSSGGDLTFLNGYLYLSTGSRKLGIINPGNGNISTVTINSTVNYSGWGLITLGDGYLYITHNNSLYRVDPATWQGDATPYYNFPTSGALVNGLSTYAEHCNAPVCSNPGIAVTIAGGPPFCASAGVTLTATGSGITGPDTVDWILPDGSKASGSTLPARLSGVYKARYHNIPDDCGHDTSFTLNLIPSPQAYLGGDTGVCPGGTITLAAKDPTGITSWLWQDGATTPGYLVSGPGTYTLQASNACGVSNASVQVQLAALPAVQLPDDTEMCSFDSLELRNALHVDGFRYRWQDGSTGLGLMAHGPGIYWVDVSTSCSTVRDSVVVRSKQHGCELRFRTPNAFSPTGNSNTLFKPVITGPLLQYEFVVYNRWGQQVFHTTSRSAGWNGRVNGSLQATGVFVWSCVYRFIGQPAITQKGTVLLLR